MENEKVTSKIRIESIYVDYNIDIYMERNGIMKCASVSVSEIIDLTRYTSKIRERIVEYKGRYYSLNQITKVWFGEGCSVDAWIALCFTTDDGKAYHLDMLRNKRFQRRRYWTLH